MKFLTSEKDLIITSDGILCFYSSALPFSTSSMLFTVASKLKQFGQMLCIDLHYFDNMVKRFNITSVPTLIIIKNNVETKRIIGLPAIKDVDDILAGA